MAAYWYFLLLRRRDLLAPAGRMKVLAVAVGVIVEDVVVGLRGACFRLSAEEV